MHRCKCGDRLYPEDGEVCPFCTNNPDVDDADAGRFVLTVVVATVGAALISFLTWGLPGVLS